MGEKTVLCVQVFEKGDHLFYVNSQDSFLSLDLRI